MSRYGERVLTIEMLKTKRRRRAGASGSPSSALGGSFVPTAKMQGSFSDGKAGCAWDFFCTSSLVTPTSLTFIKTPFFTQGDADNAPRPRVLPATVQTPPDGQGGTPASSPRNVYFNNFALFFPFKKNMPLPLAHFKIIFYLCTHKRFLLLSPPFSFQSHDFPHILHRPLPRHQHPVALVSPALFRAQGRRPVFFRRSCGKRRRMTFFRRRTVPSPRTAAYL